MDINKFKQFLLIKGCEILPQTNPYENIRWQGSEVGVIYNTGKTNGIYATKALLCFKNNRLWNGGPIKTAAIQHISSKRKH